jgi:hypothetical protein
MADFPAADFAGYSISASSNGSIFKTRHFPEGSSVDSAAVLKRKRFRGVVAGRSLRARRFSYFSQPAPIVAVPLNSEPNFIADGNNCSLLLLLPPSGG